MNDIKTYKCPCCGSPLVFDGTTQNLHCESCGNDFEAETLRQLEEGEESASGQSKFDWENYVPRYFTDPSGTELSGYSCPSCGAEIVGDETLGATVCPYCGNATIVKGAFEGTLRPDYLIPFKLDKKAAMAAFENACKDAPFLPDEFRDKRKIEEMAGVYVPFWMFDCDCDANISYSAQRMSVWSDSRYNYEKIDFYKLMRSGSVGFSNIPVDASQKTDNDYMEAVEPYDYSAAVDFNTAYLSGYLADKYDVSVEDSIGRATDRVKNSVASVFRSTTSGYQAVTADSTNVNVTDGKIRYSLLPVWMLNIKYMDQMYKYVINGQTGKTSGTYPISKKKRNIFFAKVYGISLAVAIAAAYVFLRFM